MAAPSVGRRLTLAFVVILALFAANLAITIWSDWSRARAFSELDRALHRRVLISQIRQQLSNLHREVTLLGEVRFDPGSKPSPDARRGFDEHLALVSADIQTLDSLATDSLRTEVRQLRTEFTSLEDLWRKFYDYLGVEEGWSVAYLARADPLSRRLLANVVMKIENDGVREAADARLTFDQVTAQSRTVTLLIFITSVVLALVIASRTSRYLVGRIYDLAHGADMIGEVSLDHRIAVEPRDEMGDLAHHFNVMATRLDVTRSELQRANADLSNLNVLLEERIEEQQAREKLAAHIQRDLLPKEPPRVQGYQLAGRSIPAQTVGGDYFDYVVMDEGRLAVCLGDASGKGLPASLLMASLQAAIRTHVMAFATVANTLRRINTLLFRSTDPGTFVTAFYCILDLGRHELRYSNAGHNPPLVFRADSVERLEIGGTILGAFEDSDFEEASCRLAPGDFLVVYSDGITEARNDRDDEFGEDGLIEVVTRKRDSSAEDLVTAVVAAVTEFAGSRRQMDDMTMIVLKRA
jgi:sigma-B regulation protein RsbU (phosphoserine phosphatase)